MPASRSWRRPAGHAVLIDLEGHGREEMFADVDLSRTVGWFTSLYPVRLDAGALDLDEAISGGAALGRALKLIKEQLRRCRTTGSAMGCCATSTAETASQLSGFAVPQIGFNYLGRFAARAGAGTGRWLRGGGAWRRRRPGDAAGSRDRGQCADAGGADGAALTGDLDFCACAALRGCGCDDLARALVRSAGGVGAPCGAPGAGGRSPSDLPLVSLSQGEIERLEGEYPQIEDMLPLSPLQEGLLFHALYDAQAPDVYSVQLVLALAGSA